jgi:MFS family permease
LVDDVLYTYGGVGSLFDNLCPGVHQQLCNPDPLLLGLAAAGRQGGALVGALIGGW